MKKPRDYWFYDSLYLFNFRLVWPVTKASLEKYILKEFGIEWESEHETFGGKALNICDLNGRQQFLIALSAWNGNADDHACLGHECLHIANFILAHRGVEVSLTNDEAQAYLLGYLQRQCLNALLPKKLHVKVNPAGMPKRMR